MDACEASDGNSRMAEAIRCSSSCVHGLPAPAHHCTEIEAGRGHGPRWRFAGGSSKLAPLTGCLVIGAAVVEAVGGAAAMEAGAGEGCLATGGTGAANDAAAEVRTGAVCEAGDRTI